jgi:CBS domain containing-hemolysin-like protein
MDPTLVLLLVLLPVTLLTVAFCSASEAAFFSLTRTDRIRIRRQSPTAGAAAQRVLRNPRKLVLSVLLITNAASVVFYVVVTMLERRIESKALSIGANVALLLLMVLAADLLPKLLASASPVRLASLLAIPLDGAIRITGPVTRFFEGFFVAPLIRLLRAGAPSAIGAGGRQPTAAASPPVTVEELGALLELSASTGEIERDEQKLLADVIRLGSTRVRDVMVPRVAMPWVTERSTPADVLRAVKRTPSLQVPVFRGSLEGHPVGWLNSWRYLAAAEAAGEGTAPAQVSETELAPITVVPERARLDQLIDLLRARRVEQAICVDEYGTVVGMVSIQEIARELATGASGFDRVAWGASHAIERRSEHTWVIPGRLPARELASLLGLSRDRGGQVSTVAGLLIQRLGRVPVVGDSVRIGNVELKVESVQGRGISTVALTLKEPRDAAAGGSRGIGVST